MKTLTTFFRGPFKNVLMNYWSGTSPRGSLVKVEPSQYESLKYRPKVSLYRSQIIADVKALPKKAQNNFISKNAWQLKSHV